MHCLSPLCLVISMTLPVDAPTDADIKKDLQRFQGAWQAASILNADGQPATAEELERTRLVVDGNKFTLKGKDYTITGRFTIDPGKSPKTIDVELDAKEGERPVKLLGIYSMDGETRRSCFVMENEKRPATFPSAPKGYIKVEWKRPQVPRK